MVALVRKAHAIYISLHSTNHGSLE